MTAIDMGPGYDRLLEAMIAEGVTRIHRHHRLNNRITVELECGKIGGGSTPREAIENAKAWQVVA